MTRQQLLPAAVAVLLLVAMTTVGEAQTTSLVGTLVDETGAVLPGATVTLTGPRGRELAASDATGTYRFENVAAGTYQISALLSGFAPATRENIVVGAAPVTVPARKWLVWPLLKSMVKCPLGTLRISTSALSGSLWSSGVISPSGTSSKKNSISFS